MEARLEVIGIVVRDMGRSLAFYRQLGLQPPENADGEGHVEAELAGGIKVAWDTEETIRSFDPDWEPPAKGHRMGLAFRLDTPADVDSAYSEILSAGYEGHKEPWDAFWGMRYAVVHDPDGNSVDLFAPLEG